METPEKIYLDSYGAGFSHGFHTNKLYDNDIEYTRTDTFIKKVCEGIEHLLSGYIIKNFNFGDSYETDTFIKDLKNYIKE